MMSKLKQMLAASAALVAGGMAIAIALTQSGQSVGMTEEEWCYLVEKVNYPQQQREFFVAVASGVEIPKESGGRLLGDCSDGTCTVAPSVVQHCAATYSYRCGPAVGGWRVCVVMAHPYFANGWRLEADVNPDFRWYGGMGEAVDECLVHFTKSECLTLFDADNRCWGWFTEKTIDTELTGEISIERLTGKVCRYGRETEGATETQPPPACTYDYAGRIHPIPCVTHNGAGAEQLEGARVWAAGEMDIL